MIASGNIKPIVLFISFLLLVSLISCVEQEKKEETSPFVETNTLKPQKRISETCKELMADNKEETEENIGIPGFDFEFEEIPKTNPPHGEKGHDCAIPVGSPLEF